MKTKKFDNFKIKYKKIENKKYKYHKEDFPRKAIEWAFAFCVMFLVMMSLSNVISYFTSLIFNNSINEIEKTLLLFFFFILVICYILFIITVYKNNIFTYEEERKLEFIKKLKNIKKAKLVWVDGSWNVKYKTINGKKYEKTLFAFINKNYYVEDNTWIYNEQNQLIGKYIKNIYATIKECDNGYHIKIDYKGKKNEIKGTKNKKK